MQNNFYTGCIFYNKQKIKCLNYLTKRLNKKSQTFDKQLFGIKKEGV